MLPCEEQTVLSAARKESDNEYDNIQYQTAYGDRCVCWILPLHINECSGIGTIGAKGASMLNIKPNRHGSISILWAYVIVSLAGCPHPNPNPVPNPNPNPPSDTLSFEQRRAVLTDTEQAVASARHLLPGERSDTLVKFLRSRPEIEQVGAAEDGTSVWARFVDGHLLMIPFDVDTEDDTSDSSPGRSGQRVPGQVVINSLIQTPRDVSRQAASSGPLGVSMQASTGAASGSGLPASTRALVVDTAWDLPLFAPPISKLLETKKYTVIPAEYGTVAALDEQNLGVMYLHGHGGTAWTRDGHATFGISTRDEVPCSPRKMVTHGSVTAPACKGKLPENEGLAYMIFEEGKEGEATFYAITEDYIRNHKNFATFAPNSLVVINACHLFEHTSFISVLHDVRKASIVVGWSGKIKQDCGKRVDMLLFDRLLGANSAGVKKREPPLRPFPLFDVLHDKDLGSCPGATLQVSAPSSGATGILAPSITSLTVDEERAELKLHGNFGDRRGSVEIDGSTPKEIDGSTPNCKDPDWSNSEITCGLPPSGGGQVTVEVDGRRSNPVKLTEWHFILKNGAGVDWDQNSSMFDLWFRADIHCYRTNINDDELLCPKRVPFSAEARSLVTLHTRGRYPDRTWDENKTITNRVALSETVGLWDLSNAYAAQGYINVRGKRFVLSFGASYQFPLPSAMLMKDNSYMWWWLIANEDLPWRKAWVLQLNDKFSILPSSSLPVQLEQHDLGKSYSEWDMAPAAWFPAADDPG